MIDHQSACSATADPMYIAENKLKYISLNSPY